MCLLPHLGSKKFKIVIGLIIIALYLAHSIGRAFTKLPVCDEAWYGQPALNLATGRGMVTTVLETAGTPRHGLQQHTYWEMPFYLVAQVPWYKVFHFGLLQMRLFSITCGIIFLISWFVFVRVFFQSQVIALVASALLAVDFEIVNVSVTGRSDVMCAALGAAAFASYMVLRRRHFKTALLLGNALVAGSGMTHPNGLIYLVVLAILVFSFDRKRLAWIHLLIVGAPYLVGAALWGAYILQAPADFVAQFGGSASHRLGGLTLPWFAVKGEFLRYRNAYGFRDFTLTLRSAKGLVLLAYVAGVAGVLFSRKDTPSRLWLKITAVVFVMMVFYESAKQEWYLIHILPFFAALLGVCVVKNWQGRAMARWAMIAGLAMVLLLETSLTVWLIHKDDYSHRFLPAVNFLKAHLGQNSMIMGSSELGFELPFEQVIDDYRLGFYSHKNPQFIVVEPNYQGAFLDFVEAEPQVYQHIQRLLRTEYRIVYDDGYYSIYTR